MIRKNATTVNYRSAFLPALLSYFVAYPFHLRYSYLTVLCLRPNEYSDL